MTPGPQPIGVHVGFVQINGSSETQRPTDDDSPDLASIAARWEGIEDWDAPLRNPMWIEREDGRPVAAVTGSFDELVAGIVERRRQAIAHAPEDIRALLHAIEELRSRRVRRGPNGSANGQSHLSAA